MRATWVVAGLATLLLAAESVMFVDSDEVAVVFRFGAVACVGAAGLGLRLPRPIESDTRVGVTEVQRLSLDRRRIITGDTNLVDVSLVAQFTVADPVAWLVALRNPDTVVKSEVDAAASSVIATMGVDELLTTARARLQQRIADDAQARLDVMGTGVRLVAVDVRELVPPPAVVDAFNDVSSARGDQQTLALAADAYASEVIPDARGKAARQVEGARATAAEQVARARQDVHRFDVLAEEHAHAPAALEQALHARTVQTVGKKARVVVAPAGTGVVLPR